MQAIVLKDFGGTDQLEYTQIPTPSIKDDEVLVRTSAIGINPVDIKTRIGKGQAAKLKADPPMILGWDVSGKVTAVRKGVTQFKTGDEVFGMINIPGHGKAYAEFVAAPAAHLSPRPATINYREAAVVGIAAMTAWQALHDQAALQAGQKILIHAASGGVGHFAVQFAKWMGAYVIGTSSAENRDFVLSLGADEHIDYKAKPFEEVCQPVDVIIDAIGGDHIDRSLQVLKKGGTIISLPSGVSESVSEKAASQGKRGIFFFTQSNGKDQRQIASLFLKGVVTPHVSKVFAFDKVREAHEFVEKGKTVGKVVMDGPKYA